MKLNYTHWKYGPVEREVEPLRSDHAEGDYYHDRATIYLIGANDSVFNAGSWLGDRGVFNYPVRIGFDAAMAE